MSFGKKKMHEIASGQTDILAKDHRGMEYMVITKTGYHFGTAAIDGPGNENVCGDIDSVPLHFRAWAKKMVKAWESSLPKEEAA